MRDDLKLVTCREVSPAGFIKRVSEASVTLAAVITALHRPGISPPVINVSRAQPATHYRWHAARC